MNSKPSVSLYLITDDGPLRSTGKLVWAVEEALRGAKGAVRYVQLREKSAEDNEILSLLESLKPICQRYNCRLLTSRRGDLAVQADIDGIHLGGDSISLKDARVRWPSLRLFGYSAHNVSEAIQASNDGADYILLAPIFGATSKSDDTRLPLGVEAIAELRRLTKCEVYALGGINPKNAAVCRDAGATGVATISAVLKQPDPANAAYNLVLALM